MSILTSSSLDLKLGNAVGKLLCTKLITLWHKHGIQKTMLRRVRRGHAFRSSVNPSLSPGVMVKTSVNVKLRARVRVRIGVRT